MLLFAQQAAWKVAKESGELKVYTRDCDKQDLKDCKGEISINAAPEELARILMDFDSYPKWMDRNDGVKVLEQVSIGKYYLHYLTTAPWPVSDRDNVCLFTCTKNDDGGFSIVIESTSDYLPDQNGYVRVPYSYSTWDLQPEGSGTSVEHFSCASSGGGLPAWLANMGVVDYPFNTLRDLKKYAESR